MVLDAREAGAPPAPPEALSRSTRARVRAEAV
jgi:hypothetical protein